MEGVSLDGLRYVKVELDYEARSCLQVVLALQGTKKLSQREPGSLCRLIYYVSSS